MHPALNYHEMKAKIPMIKHLFQTRHYIQCAAECKRLLTSSNIYEIHPVHQACLNFYFALSHDTMAREASMRNRVPELDLAEKHYIAALVSLTPSEPQRLENIQEFQSPTSSTSEDEPNYIGRRPSATSLNSQHSNASSETSYADDDDFFADWERPARKSEQFKHSTSYQNIQDKYAQTPKLQPKQKPSPIITRPTHSTHSIYQEQFFADLSAFTAMVQSHLASVRELKEASAVAGNRFSFSTRSRSSTVGSRPVSRDSIVHGDAAGMENLRLSRRSMVFRPRFDSSSVQELCQDALAEL